MIDEKSLLQRNFSSVEQVYDELDTSFYALSLGIAQDPNLEEELRFVYGQSLPPVPTMATVLADPGFWWNDPETGIAWQSLVHGEQSVMLHRALPSSGRIVGKTRIASIRDGGKERGAYYEIVRTIADEQGEPLATLRSLVIGRKDGGFGGEPPLPRNKRQKPGRAPDHSVTRKTAPNTALLYRLNGDTNPLHADPLVAAAAGFERPVLHGLCTLGIASFSVVQRFCAGNPALLSSIEARFSAPVFPGETLRTEIWVGDATADFRTVVAERDVEVLSGGYATLR